MNTIEVKPGTAPEMLVTAVRYLIVFLGGILVQRGTFTAEQWAQIGGWLVGAVPLAWGVWSTFRNKKKLITAADPNDPTRLVLTK